MNRNEKYAGFFEELHRDVNEKLNQLEINETNFIERLKHSVELCKNAGLQLRRFAEENEFDSQEEEISFFKEMKPEIESLSFYYNYVLKIELAKPIGDKKNEELYYNKELQKVNEFFKDNSFLFQYYRSGSTYLDDKLFVRTNYDTVIIPFYREGTDDLLSSACDYIIAKVLANEKLSKYLTDVLKNLNENENKNFQTSTKLKWTDSKTGLIEWLYSLYVKGSFNHGQAELKEIAKAFEIVFDIDLGNYYRAFQEIRIRKERAKYIKECLEGVIAYMDESDLNYRRH